MATGRPVLVSESVADHFLYLQPPRCVFGGGFAFQGPGVPMTVFMRTGHRGLPWLAQRGPVAAVRQELQRLLPHARLLLK